VTLNVQNSATAAQEATKIRTDSAYFKSLGLEPFMEYLGLAPIDYMGIKDLLEFGEYHRDPVLIFMLMNLYAAMGEGSVCLLLIPESFGNKFPKGLRSSAQKFLTQFTAALTGHHYDRLISCDHNAFVPLIWVAQPVTRLYFQKYYACEADLKAGLFKFLDQKEKQITSPENAFRIVEDLYLSEHTIRIGLSGAPIIRDSIQIEALILGLTSRLAIISGGPGTGKTSLMVNLIRGVLQWGLKVGDIILGAPTGRAAQRMTEAIRNQMATIKTLKDSDFPIDQLKGATLHRILQYDPMHHRFYYNEKRLLPARMIIIDEVSMVDLVMMRHLIKAVDPKTTRLVFLGDKNQLPSVEAGAVLADLIPQTDSLNRFKDHLVVLKTVFRSGRDLIRLAEDINSGKMPILRPIPPEDAIESEEQGWGFVENSEENQLPDLLSNWIQKQYLKVHPDSKKSYFELVRLTADFTGLELEQTETGQGLLRAIFAVVEKSRILTLTRVGNFGCDRINAALGRILIRAMRQTSRFYSDVRSNLFSGAQIIIRRNDYAKELFNGDMGVVLMDIFGTIKIYFQRSNAFSGYSVDVLPPFELSFALTVHKSQGSEYENILLILPDDSQYRLLTREMLYTAVTRAQRRAVIYGRKEVFEKAVGRRMLRQTGMVESIPNTI
jgi:exodeoxyribonuclease V alpha subunit